MLQTDFVCLLLCPPVSVDAQALKLLLFSRLGAGSPCWYPLWQMHWLLCNILRKLMACPQALQLAAECLCLNRAHCTSTTCVASAGAARAQGG